MQITEWNFGTFAHSVSADIKIGQQVIYKVNIYKRAPDNPKVRRDITQKCRKDKAVSIWCYIGPKSPGGIIVSIKAAAVWLAKLGLPAGDLENFFQAAEMMGWEDDLILEACRAANQFITAPESSAYLVIRLLSGVVGEYEYLPTLAEAQQAVADHCGVETTDLQSTAGIPWGAVFSATNGDKYDAWAFPVHDSGENIADLSARVEVVSQHRWQLWEAFQTAAARLRVHGLEVPDMQLPPGTGCPYCGSQRAVTKNDGVFAEASPVLVCQDCKSIWSSTCPECGSTDITHTWNLNRSPSGYVRRQTLVWKCGSCEHTWDWDEEAQA